MAYSERDLDVAWAAGLFEGEGSFSSTKRTRQIRMGMTDLDVLERFQRIVRVGKVYGPRNKQEGRKPMYDWASMKWDDICYVIELFWPFLSPRRRAAAQTILDHPPGGTANGLKTHCPQQHPYAGHNLIIRKDGSRNCRACKNDSQRRARRVKGALV